MERKPIIEVYSPRPGRDDTGRVVINTYGPRRTEEVGQAKPQVPSGGSGVQQPQQGKGRG